MIIFVNLSWNHVIDHISSGAEFGSEILPSRSKSFDEGKKMKRGLEGFSSSNYQLAQHTSELPQMTTSHTCDNSSTLIYKSLPVMLCVNECFDCWYSTFPLLFFPFVNINLCKNVL